MPELAARAYKALLAGARKAHPAVEFDSIGYARDWRDNLGAVDCLQAIQSDFGGGAGRELAGKFRAAHSSAALVVNAFHPWRLAPDGLKLAGVSDFRGLRFEAVCPTGLKGTPPHLDLLADGETPVAVESKCTEWMSGPKPVNFSTAYDRLETACGDSPWFAQVAELRANPKRYQYLDAAQLVKHALGLGVRHGSRAVKLVYLYWEPRNAVDWRECAAHRAEVEDLRTRAVGGTVTLVPMSYAQLWKEWARLDARHLPYLWTRYDRIV
jgi:hypothetical protein